MPKRKKSDKCESQSESRNQEKPRPRILNPKTLFKKKPFMKWRNDAQAECAQLVDDNQITFITGPAGTGKSAIGVFKAAQLLCNADAGIKNIIIFKPAVEVEDKIGALPGTEAEKMRPYIQGTIDLMEKLIGTDLVNQLLDLDIIKVRSLSFIRGCNIDNTVVLMEESQNLTRRQMQLLLTRLGENSKIVVSGDVEQYDRKNDKSNSALNDAERLAKIKGIGHFEFGVEHIVRNPLVGKIIDVYQGYTPTDEIDDNIRREPMFED